MQAEAPPGRGTVTLAGLFRSPTGIGEGARLMAAALAEGGYSIGLMDCSQSLPSDVLRLMEGPGLVAGDVGGPLVLHANPPLMQEALVRFRQRLRERAIFAYWAWELPVVPRAWHAAVALVHEIWVPSRFVADAVAAAAIGKRVRIVPHAVRARGGRAAPIDVPPGCCVFLCMFSDGSGFERKNPVATIHAFRRAFGDRPDVLLVLKYQVLARSDPRIERRLRDAIAGASNIRIVEGVLSVEERDALIARADVMVSLHRSEGFGLTLAEAMLAGKPVIATGWSGNLDFMTAETSSLVRCRLVPVSDPDGPYDGLATVWAEPDLDHAATEMRRLRDADTRLRLGAAARKAGESLFGASALVERVSPAVGSAARGIPAASLQQQPAVS